MLKRIGRWKGGWYNKFFDCNTGFVGDLLTCDEYPYGSVLVAGEPGYHLGIVSIKLVPEYEQSFVWAESQANKLLKFYSAPETSIVALHPIKGWFGSFASFAYESFWIDRKGNLHEF